MSGRLGECANAFREKAGKASVRDLTYSHPSRVAYRLHHGTSAARSIGWIAWRWDAKGLQ
jgi:hypothetical protein